MKFKDKIVWITGASSGIGEALCYEYARNGAKVLLSARSEDKLKAICEKIQSEGGQASIYPLDLSKPDEIEPIAKKVISQEKQIDILINNGGISQRSLASETSLDIDRKLMEVNYFGSVALTKAVLPKMIAQQSGQIVAISSITGLFGFPLRSAYAASKHALKGFFESVLLENRKHNIFVTMVYPGRVQSNISLNAITKSGEKYGKMDDGQAEGMPADTCAKKIVKAVEKRKKEILVGNKELLMAHFKRYIPSLFYKIALKIKAT
jgi:dehydrogenase/reductase SDR family protein 7B